jgi:hypothetical protein
MLAAALLAPKVQAGQSGKIKGRRLSGLFYYALNIDFFNELVSVLRD